MGQAKVAALPQSGVEQIGRSEEAEDESEGVGEESEGVGAEVALEVEEAVIESVGSVAAVVFDILSTSRGRGGEVHKGIPGESDDTAKVVERSVCVKSERSSGYRGHSDEPSTTSSRWEGGDWRGEVSDDETPLKSHDE